MSLSKFGIASSDFDKDSLDIPQIGKLRMYKADDSKLKEQLRAEVDETKRENRFPIVADVSNRPENVELYNACGVPFVMQAADHKTRIDMNARTKQLAVISDDFNKHSVAFDAIMREYGRRFPGLFRGFELVGDGMTASRHLLHSFNDLLDKSFHQEKSENKQMKILEGHAEQEFAFKDGKGTTAFSFKRSVGPEEFADGMADAIQFLAFQAQQPDIPARVYSMVDVARRAPLMML